MPLLEEIRDHLDDQARVNRAICANRCLAGSKMNELHAAYHLITQLTQNTELKRFHADRKIGAAKIDANEKQRRQVQRDIDNVQGVDRRIDRISEADATKPLRRSMHSFIKEIRGLRHEKHHRDPLDAARSRPSAILRTRLFRQDPVLSWTIDRSSRGKAGSSDGSLLGRSGRIGRADRGGRSCRHAVKGPRQTIPSLEAIAAAQKFADGWRGGLLSTCEFDIGFYAPWLMKSPNITIATRCC